MGVFSDGSYGTPEGVMFSFPITISGGKWSIKQGLSISDFARGKLDIKWFPSRDMVAGFLTKSLQGKLFLDHGKRLLGL